MRRLPSLLVTTCIVAACQPQAADVSATDSPAAASGPVAGSLEWKIQTYSTAAPASIAANATVLDWSDSLQAPGPVIRQGTNGWTCMPVMPPPAGGYATALDASPMCADSMTMLWAQGHMTKTKPKNPRIGIGYMLHGDKGVSNTDPYATAPTNDNDWVSTGPHVMVFPADPARIRDIPTDHRSGGPYQMWKGTPYAHVMIPISGLH